MTISAMKQALEALEYYRSAEDYQPTPASEAITALRQAIAEAEKIVPSDYPNSHQQEPFAVAWVLDGELFWPSEYEVIAQAGDKAIPLYTAPVHASDTSQERVDETAKSEHDLWIASACLKSTVESAIKSGDWKVDGACDPTRDLAYLADCLANPRHEWVGLTEQDVHDAFQFTELIKQLSFDRERPEWCENFAASLEAKLKEKNK